MTGMVLGIAVWLVMQHGLWPAVDAAAAPRFNPWVFALGHMMFGAVTALLAGTSLVRHAARTPLLAGAPAGPGAPYRRELSDRRYGKALAGSGKETHTV
jgi:hypothetical protein